MTTPAKRFYHGAVRTGILVFLFAIQMAFVQQASAETVSQAIERMADEIAAHLKDQERSVSVENFGGPAGSSTGRVLQLELTQALEKRGFAKPLAGGALAVRGNFSLSFETNGAIILIEAELVDRAGKRAGTFRKQAFASGAASLEEVAKLFPSNVDLTKASQQPANSKDKSQQATDVSAEKDETDVSPAGTDKASTKKLKQSLVSPAFAFQGNGRTRISAEQSSQYHLELLVRRRGQTNFQPLAFDDAGGIPFARLADGDTYRIQVYNYSSSPIGVKVAIDGINSLALSNNAEFKRHGCWLIEGRSVGSIDGWHIDGATTREFVVTSQDRQLSLPDPGDLGTVSALVFAAQVVSDPLEALKNQYASNRKFPLHTTAGARQQTATKQTKVTFGTQLLTSLSFRYANPTDLPAGDDLN